MKTIIAEDIMSRDLTAVMSQDRVFDAIHVLYSHGLSGLPVIDDDGGWSDTCLSRIS